MMHNCKNKVIIELNDENFCGFCLRRKRREEQKKKPKQNEEEEEATGIIIHTSVYAIWGKYF